MAAVTCEQIEGYAREPRVGGEAQGFAASDWHPYWAAREGRAAENLAVCSSPQGQ